jgi:rifampicin phosphotransferase
MSLSNKNYGSKAKNLLILKNKFLVPNFFIINSGEILQILINLSISKTEIKNAFVEDDELRVILQNKIKNSKRILDFSKLKNFNEKIIIRSASLAEDGATYSFAGIYESKISPNNPNDFSKNFFEVLSCAFSKRVYYYSNQIGLKNFPDISIIIQNYIPSDYGGVTFSSTIYKNKKGMLINVAKGSANKAVLGQEVQQVFLEKGKKEFKTNIPKKIIKNVHEQCTKIENLFNSPQDIEWCYANNSLYILQSRPITKEINKEINVWDNSNIAESYSGIVLPLTCSFAQMIYAQVYRDLARTSNIDQRKINEHSEILDNLLGFFYGKFYYNILNWYKMLTLFPGYDRNKRNLDIMISAKNRAKLDERYKKNVTLFDKIKYYPYIFVRILRFEKDIQYFKDYVNSYLNRKREIKLENLSLSKLWNEFEDYEEKLLKKWSITVDNDFLAMTWFGVYKKLAKNYGLKENEVIKQIASMKSVVSANQVHHLKQLSTFIFKNIELQKYAKEKQWKKCFEEINKNVKYKKKIDEYLAIYGGRFANELKLEAKDLDTDPYYVAQVLYSYKDMQFKQKQDNNKLKLSKLKQKILFYFADKSKHYLRNREELRLLRSRAFSYTRKLFLNIGEKLKQKKLISDARDIFYLKINEIEKVVKKNKINLKQIIKNRKKEYDSYKNIELEDVLLTIGENKPKPKSKQKYNVESKIQGTACSSGIVNGKITVLDKFQLPENKYDILVVKHTDPGWTPLFGLCNGLIVEHGGLLSHAAIISRELNLPCIIGVKNATKIFKTNQKIKLNANTGIIEILK